MTEHEMHFGSWTCAGEAEGDGDEGMHAVGKVIKTRVLRRRSSILEVCFEPLQFSFWNGDSKRRSEIMLEWWGPRRMTWVNAFVSAWWGDNDPTDGADHYYADYIDPPSWAATMKHTVTIGAHLFFYSTRGPDES